MSNPSGPDQADEPAAESANEPADDASSTHDDVEQRPAEQQSDSEAPTQAAPVIEEHPTEVMEVESTGTADTNPQHQETPAERRFTAPSGMDSSTRRIETTTHDPATEVFSPPTEPIPPGNSVGPQVIPPRADTPPPPLPGRRRSWGWVVALVLVIAALVAVAILGTLLLTRGSDSRASQEDMVRTTIENFDVAVQNGDLATLRSITCGATRDSYVQYDDRAWADTHARVAAAKRYPVVASIDQIVINGDHAEANVTTFMAYAPQTRSTRSFDLQFRDDQWKICQAPSG